MVALPLREKLYPPQIQGSSGVHLPGALKLLGFWGNVASKVFAGVPMTLLIHDSVLLRLNPESPDTNLTFCPVRAKGLGDK